MKRWKCLKISSFALERKDRKHSVETFLQNCRVHISGRRTLGSCDRSGRGDGNPGGSTAIRAYQTGACHTPEGGREIREGSEEVKNN